jgi:hypothetical protein
MSDRAGQKPRQVTPARRQTVHGRLAGASGYK